MSRPTVLNTRPEDQAAELSELLEQAGFEVVEAPAIAVVAAWNPSELEAVRRDLRASLYDWVVLQSQNAAQALLDDLRGARIVCGKATAATLGLKPEVILERFNAGAALDLLRSLVLRGDRVLVPRAAEGRDELILGLRALGADAHAPVAYRTATLEEASMRLRQGGIDVVALCSPSAVYSVVRALDPDVHVVCLGETTAQAARTNGLRVDAVAESTSMAALVAAIQESVGVRV